MMHRSSIIVNLFLFAINLWVSTGNDYYEILGVSRTADLKELRKAFKKLAVIEHPDKNNDNPEAHEKFIILTKAYEILKDPVLRKRYDDYGAEGLEASNKYGTGYSWNFNSDSFEIYHRSPWIIKLEENDYYESVFYAKRVWVINFYSPRCSHCHRLVSIWNEIAEELDGAVRVGVVNCEDEWQLCQQIGIRSYPTIMHYPKNTKHGIQYNGENTYPSLLNYILNKLEVHVEEINEPLANFISRSDDATARSMIIFVCGAQRNCFTSAERLKIAAIFEDTIVVKVHLCDHEEDCTNVVSKDANVIYLSSFRDKSWHVVPFENVEETQVLVKKVLENLPEPKDLDDKEFQRIINHAAEGETPDSSWLLCFYIGAMTELNATLKRLSTILTNIKLGKIHCGRYSHMCSNLGVNRYPMWGIIKIGGAFEWYHGSTKLYDIAAFAHSSGKATNVRALNAEQVANIMEGGNANEAWFLDWYAPWCPPCMHFLKEVRKAAMELDQSIVRFGIIDCTVHSTICRQHNIHSYPTAMLVNGSSIHKFSMQKTAANVVHFVKEMLNPTVTKLTSRNFKQQLGQVNGKFIYVIDYFALWCAPCQRLTPEWISVANSLTALSFVKIASVDCEAEASLCMSQGIRSYPTIRAYFSENGGSDTFASYSGQRDSVSMLRWIIQFFPWKARDLDPTILSKEVLSDRKLWVVDFSVPWCEPCRRMESQLAIVAQLLKKKVQFGTLNCNVYVTECANARVNAYPTLIAYDGRHGRKKITNGYQINGTIAADIKRSILDFIAGVARDEL